VRRVGAMAVAHGRPERPAGADEPRVGRLRDVAAEHRVVARVDLEARDVDGDAAEVGRAVERRQSLRVEPVGGAVGLRLRREAEAATNGGNRSIVPCPVTTSLPAGAAKAAGAAARATAKTAIHLMRSVLLVDERPGSYERHLTDPAPGVLKLERHELGPRVYVLGQRIHEFALGFAILAVLLGLGLSDHLEVTKPYGGGLFVGSWLVIKDWRDLFPSKRNTAAWSLLPHRVRRK
jgi:hypothetical protein